MPVVSNTSPLLNLAIIDHLSLLQDQFGQIWIPQAVLEELRVDENLPGSSKLRDALKSGWIQLRSVTEVPLLQMLRRDLDRGEAETIALALQLTAEWVLIDEREGRKVAKSLGLRVTGILGILLRAKQEGKLISLKKTMDELAYKAGFLIGAELKSRLLKECNEEPLEISKE